MDVSIDALGRLAILHDILPEAYIRYCDSFNTHRPRSTHACADACGDGDVGQGHAGDVVDILDVALAAAPGLPGCVNQEISWDEENTLHRRLGLRSMQSGPLKLLIIMRMAVEPLRQLLSSKFEVADASWERRQQEA